MTYEHKKTGCILFPGVGNTLSYLQNVFVYVDYIPPFDFAGLWPTSLKWRHSRLVGELGIGGRW